MPVRAKSRSWLNDKSVLRRDTLDPSRHLVPHEGWRDECRRILASPRYDIDTSRGDNCVWVTNRATSRSYGISELTFRRYDEASLQEFVRGKLG